MQSQPALAQVDHAGTGDGSVGAKVGCAADANEQLRFRLDTDDLAVAFELLETSMMERSRLISSLQLV